MISNDPLKKSLRRLLISRGIMTLVVIILFVYFANPPGYPIDPVPVVLVITGLVLINTYPTRLFFLSKRLEKHRARALQEDLRVLAAEQPAPDEMALSVPTTIQYGFSWDYALFITGISIVVAMIGLLVLALVLTTSTNLPGGWSGFSILAGILVGVVLLVLVFRYFALRSRLLFITSVSIVAAMIGLLVLALVLTTSTDLPGGRSEFSILAGILVGVVLLVLVFRYFALRSRLNSQVYVDQWGITATYSQRTTHVDWSTARLFAVNTVKKARRPKVYELASSETVVRWFWIPREMRFTYPLRPAVTQEQHDRQMQALLAFVAAKTHLPLCDIGEPVARWYM
jgi:hypothetical protein